MWWPEGNTANDLKEYQMDVHVFGATSSPGCANFALRQTAEDFVSYNPETRETLFRNFYVDDLLHSAPTISSAQVLVEGASKLCQDGGFNLTKFLCPEVDVLSVLPDEKVSSSIEKIRLSHEQKVERALGIIWCIENDTLGFHVTLKDVPLTRRGILSSISSIFDPLGIASPFLLKFLEENVFEHIAVDANDPEIRKVKVLVTQTLNQFEDPLEDLCERLSSWSKIKRVVAIMVHICKKRHWSMTKMQVEDVQRAEKIILMNQQKRFLADEIKGCKKKISGFKSTLRDLDPFIDHDGLLKVGGRLNKATLDVPHNPYLLPKESIVSRRIVEHIHRTIQHEGRTSF